MFFFDWINLIIVLLYDLYLLIDGFISRFIYMEIIFVVEGVRYWFGLEYNVSKILIEYLYRKKIGCEVEFFYREEEVIEVLLVLGGKLIRIDVVIEFIRVNFLFIFFCD